MKKFLLVLAMAMPIFAYAQTSATTNSTNTNQSQSGATNEGVNNTNNFNDPSTVTEHIYGVTGSNTAVGLGSFSSSFSSDYCGGTSQAGISVPYVTMAGGHPVLGEPGVACVITRSAVHTMEFSATYGSAAAKANALAQQEDAKYQASVKSGASNTAALQQSLLYKQAADKYADMSEKLATASVYMICNTSDTVRSSLRDAGVDCPLTQEEKAQQQAKQNNEPTDPFVRARLGLPALQ